MGGFLLFILMTVVLVFAWKKIINEIRELFGFNSRDFIRKDNIYISKPLMTKYEKYFYNILVELKNEINIEIMPQVNLASIINKESNNKFRNELFRNIDFGIFTKDYEELLLLIEINDKTHNNYDRRKRDMKVDDIVNKVGIRLIKFYSNYPNRADYVKDRIREEIFKMKGDNNEFRF